MSKKKHPPAEYHNMGTRFKDYCKDLENPPYPDWKPLSDEWLEDKAIDKTFWKYPAGPWEKRVIDTGESTLYDIQVKVLEILGRGVCPYGHKPGDTFMFEGDSMKVVKTSAPAGGFCHRARSRILLNLWGLMCPGPQDYGRGEQDNFMQLTICPDAQNPVVLQLKRIKKKEPFSSKAPWMSIVKKKGMEYQK